MMYVTISLLDVLSTWLALRVGLIESNPLPALVLHWAGPGPMFLLKMVTVLLVAALAASLGSQFPRLWEVLRVSSWLLALVVLSNSLQVLAT